MFFLTGCNFTCPYCHNPELARGEYPQRIPFAEAIDFITARQGMLEGVAITGGEPTLESGIADLCKAIKSLGYPLKLDTNGSRPEVLGHLLERNLVDFVAMDIKAPLNAYRPFTRRPGIGERLEESIRLIMNTAPAYEFRTTCVAPFIDDTAIRAIARSIAGATTYVLQRFNHRAPCLDPEFNRDIHPDTDQLHRLKALAAPLVGRCILR